MENVPAMVISQEGEHHPNCWPYPAISSLSAVPIYDHKTLAYLTRGVYHGQRPKKRKEGSKTQHLYCPQCPRFRHRSSQSKPESIMVAGNLIQINWTHFFKHAHGARCRCLVCAVSASAFYRQNSKAERRPPQRGREQQQQATRRLHRSRRPIYSILHIIRMNKHQLVGFFRFHKWWNFPHTHKHTHTWDEEL